jgi:hypothetical protein
VFWETTEGQSSGRNTYYCAACVQEDYPFELRKRDVVLAKIVCARCRIGLFAHLLGWILGTNNAPKDASPSDVSARED